MSTQALENLLFAMVPGGIEAQEFLGQQTESIRATLPIEGTTGDKRAEFEAVGFVFHEKADDLFINVTFPQEWKKQPTEHSMWTDIMDGNGAKRGAIFYKAAFYDRAAHCSLTRRFDVSRTYEVGALDTTVFVRDALGKVTHQQGPYPKPDWSQPEEAQKRQAAIDAAVMAISAWLDDQYPGWRDTGKYWDSAK